MNKKWILGIATGVLLVLGITTLLHRVDPNVQHLMQTASLTIASTTLEVEVAVTDQEQKQGLSGRTSLGEQSGMLFQFPTTDRHGIWMHDMHFPIDVLWLSSDLQVVHIVADMQPDSYPEVYRSPVPTSYVLEVRAGSANRLGIQVGDQVRLE